MASTSRIAWTAVLVCAACYVGAAIGNAVRFPNDGAAILYPPYAVVAAALIFSPPRRWWIYLLAGSVGSFGPNWNGGAPASFVLLTELANYTRALVVGAGMWRFGAVEGRLDTLRGMGVFMLFAVVLAPLAAAFVGAGVVTLHGRGGYWQAWQPWLLSNVLTGLTLLPMILVVRARVRAAPYPIARRRLLEAGVLWLGLCAVGGLVLLQPSAWGANLSAPLYATLPLLLWAAVRFGPLGTSASVLMVAVLAITGTFEGRGPFVSSSPAGDLLELQLFLVVTAVPLLLLTALIQEQRRTARALAAGQQQYRAVVEDQTELICRFRPDGTLTFVNGACCRALRRSREELLGSDFWVLVPAERRDAERSRLAALTRDQPIATWEHQVARDATGDRWEQWTVRALFDERDHALDYQAVGSDITEGKRGKEQHALLEAERRLAEALRDADRRKDEFISVLAHELRNPLAPIVLANEILRSVRSDDEHLRTAREIIGRQSAQLAHLVDDLLEVARISSSKFQPRVEPLDLAPVIAAAVEASRRFIAAHGQRLTTVLPPGPLPVRGDAARLAQLISNLLNNSAKYSDDGGRIDLTVAHEQGELVLRFKDHGVGIPQDMLERVFEPFTQVDSERDAALGGLGLGLHLVKRVAELHGGSVRAHSDGPGLGSELVVRLPRAAAPSDSPPVPAEARSA